MKTNMNAAIVEEARRYIGVKEWPGARSNPAVEVFFARAGHPGLTDDVPWCAAFVGAVLAQCGVQPSGSLMARSYLKWGTKVSFNAARPGDVVVFSRGNPPQGHVAFFLSMAGGKVSVIGGNQGDAVTIADFSAEKILDIRRAYLATGDGIDMPPVQFGDYGPFVLDVQEKLKRLRYFSGRLDGNFGKLTREAVLAFQADHGLEVDGIAGPETSDALAAALAKEAPRADRDATVGDMRKGGSRIVRAADHTEAAAGLGVITTSIAAVREATDQAAGIIPTLRALVMDNWMLLIVVVLMVAVMVYARQARAARVDDARTGANLKI